MASAVNAAKAQIVGAKQIDHYWHARLVTLMLEAFGDHPDAYFFIEALSPHGNIPRPDLVMLHPQTGVLVLENKGIDLSAITSVRATEITIRRNGVESREDPLRQAERVMYGIRDLCKPHADISRILFLSAAVFPAITRQDYTRRFSTVIPPGFLFAEDCATAGTLREVIVRLADDCAPAYLPSRRLTRDDGQLVISVLTGHTPFRSERVAASRRPDMPSLGAEIRSMESSIRHPTDQQKSLGNADLSGGHRLFRGVAGSGKSILLTLNAAHALYRLTQHTGELFGAPTHPPRILVLCYNRTLKYYLKDRIADRYRRLAWAGIPQNSLHVHHFESLISDLIKDEPSLKTPYNYEQRQDRAQIMCQAMDRLASAALAALQFDHIYVDETQDLYPEEIELIRRLARSDPNGRQTLILFYDNAQNIYGVKAPVWDKLGIQVVGRTIFLDQCLRNTQQIVNFAFNVLVGSYAPAGTSVKTRQFADVANLLQRGLIHENGSHFDIGFCRRHGAAPLVTFHTSRRAEIDAVAQYVHQLTHRDDVMPSDILILAKHYKFMHGLQEAISAALGHHGTLRMVNADNDRNKNSYLFAPGILTLSTVASAKGYDAPVVFVIGADEFHGDNQGRASFYVACTRAKLALIVTGVRKPDGQLIHEIEASAAAVRQSQKPVAPLAIDETTCPHCHSIRLHAQNSPRGFNYQCIDCLSAIPINSHCPRCRKLATLKMEGRTLMLQCPCGPDRLIYTNQPLECW